VFNFGQERAEERYLYRCGRCVLSRNMKILQREVHMGGKVKENNPTVNSGTWNDRDSLF